MIVKGNSVECLVEVAATKLSLMYQSVTYCN